MPKQMPRKGDLDAQKKSFASFKDLMQKGKTRLVSTTREDKTKLVQLSIIVKTLGISFFISFISFFMIQVVWSDAIKSALPSTIDNASISSYWIQLVLLVGLFSSLAISLVIFIIYGLQKDVTGERKDQSIQMITSAFSSFLITFFMFVFISFVTVYLYDPLIFSSLAFVDYFGVVFQVMSDFVVYIYPQPTSFWLISIAVYYSILAVFFVLRVSRSKRLDGKYRRKRAEELRRKITGTEKTMKTPQRQRTKADVDVSIFLR